ncbi:hypothetical protein [Variovorax sp. ZT4R33]|uniref:hypothetical protein n=1 Tax=Variovorax sp. ZT4R33 TaxID=3443743 RepID=UPI003F491460
MKSMDGFRATALQWGRDASGALTARYWGFFLAAFVLAAGVAEKVYKGLNLPQRYAELIVGSITWSYENKFHDYAVLYAVIGAFLVAVVVIGSVAASLSRCVGSGGADRLHDFVLILCLPAVLWLAGLLTTKNTSLDLVHLSQSLLVVGLVLAAALVCRGPGFWGGALDRFSAALYHALLFIVLAALGIAALGVACNRLGAYLHLERWMGAGLTAQGMALATCGALATCLWLIWRAPSPERLLVAMRRLVLCAQCLLPLFLLCLIPPAWTTPAVGTLEAGFQLSAFAILLVIGCVAAAYVELYVRIRRTAGASPEGAAPLQLLTVGSAVGLLLFFKTTPYSLPELMSDDYHFGEMLVPWWSWFRMGLVPFWDYAPARGLMNYFPGLLASSLFGGAPAPIGATYPFVYAALAVVAIPVLRPVLGMSGVMVALLLGPFANGIGEIDLAVSIFFFAFCWGWLHWRRDRWLAGLAVATVLLLLYAPGQGALALLACAPLALAALWNLYLTDRRRLGFVLFAIVGVLALLFGLTPLGKMFYGALRYGAEQSQINSIAHGIQWSASFGAEGLNPWAFELMRASFVLVALWAGVVVFKAAFMADVAARRRILAYAVPVLLVTSLFVIRAAGRIDPGGSRLGIASVWALSLLLPMLLFVAQRPRVVHFVVWIGIMGLLMPYAGSLSAAGYAGNFDPPDATALLRAPNAGSIENGRLGSALANPAHLARIVAVRKVLDQVLDPQETYLDLSGRHAMYYYVERKPAVESASPYNLVGEKQQLRAIRAFRAAPPPAILLSADNIVHDGGPSSLRSNLLYRDVLLAKGYKLVSIDKQVWLIRPDRVGRLTAGPAIVAVDLDSAAAVAVLDPIFHLQNLESLPASWGRSAKTLENGLAPVLRIQADAPSSMSAVRPVGDGRYAITGEDPHVRFDLSGSKPSGRQAGLLSFEFSCTSPQAVPMVGVYWSTPDQPEGATTFMTFRGRQGRLIVPVDSAPSWLLAERIDTIRFDVDGSVAGCETFSIRDVALLARTATQKAAD